jgi:hypothetical protein
LYRLKGELTLQQFNVQGSKFNAPNPQTEAEACFLKALEVARQQNAKSFELRTSMSLARLWQHQGKSIEARELLEGIYDWFSEGFDTRDLREAEALLVTFGGKVKPKRQQQLESTVQSPTSKAHSLVSGVLPIVSVAQEQTVSFQTLDSRHQTQDLLSPTPAYQPLTPNVFRNEGDSWTLTFSRTTCRVRDTLGMHYLAQLLRHPHEEVHVLTLVAEDVPLSGNGPAETTTPDNMQVGFSNAGEVLDPQARVAYRQRLRDLQEELEEARSFNDPGRVEKLQEEIEFLTHELAQAVGLGGRTRKAASVAERARVNVTKRIKIALRKISEQHPTLGNYLIQTIRTGTFCEYVPLPHRPVIWKD